MARRVLILSLVLGMAAAAGTFASGQRDGAAPAPGAITGQSVTISGPVSFTNQLHPTLKSGDKVYTLLVPRRLIYTSGIKEGATVTIVGYQASSLPPWADVADGSTPVYVTRATVDGKDYDLSQSRGPLTGGGWDGDDRGRGRGRGMMGGGGMGTGWRS